MSSSGSFGGLGGLVSKLTSGSTTNAKPNTVAPSSVPQTNQGAVPVNQTVTPANGTSAAAGPQDYGDKAFAFIAKKSGHSVDAKTSEKITDGARGLFEKFTGKKVSSKFSN